MKITRIIFALYIAWLVLYPCGDGVTCKDEENAGKQVQNVSNHEHSDEERDLCSPFCDCACCNAQINQPDDGFLVFFNPDFSSVEFALSESKLCSLAHPIWQPPKLS